MVATLVRGRGRRDVSGHGAPGMLPLVPFLELGMIDTVVFTLGTFLRLHLSHDLGALLVIYMYSSI